MKILCQYAGIFMSINMLEMRVLAKDAVRTSSPVKKD